MYKINHTNCSADEMDNLSSQSMSGNNLILTTIRTIRTKLKESDTNLQRNLELPLTGTLVEERKIRKAGSYILSPNFRSTIVSGISQYLCKKENTNIFFTIKILPLKTSNETNKYTDLVAREILHTEYSLLSMLYDVPGVVKVHEIFKDYALEEKQVCQNLIYTGKMTERICMVLDCYTPPDYCNKFINLQHYIIQQKRLSEKQAITIFHNILLIVESLHNRNVVHRDLKLGNFLYDRLTHNVILFNFGLGKHLPNENFLLTDQKGSPAYISPDVISGKPYIGKPSDMWALGVLLYAMLYGQFPFHDTKSETLFDKIRAGDYVIPMGENISILTVQLTRGLLTLDATQRFTVKRALEQVALIISEFRGSTRDDSLQIVPDIDNYRLKPRDDGRQYERSQYLHRERQDSVVKINLLSVKQYETTLRGLGSQIPIQQIGQDARAITPSEMMQFTQLLQRMPYTESSSTMSMTRSDSREVPELQPSSSSQHVSLASRRRGHPPTSELGPERSRGRYRVDRRMRLREKERHRAVSENRQPTN